MIKLVRKSDGFVLSNVPGEWVGWRPSFIMPRLKTITGVSVLQKISVREYETNCQFLFASRFPQSNLNRMEAVIDAAHDLRLLEFTDGEGYTYDVRIADTPVPERDTTIRHWSLYRMNLLLLREGFIR